MRIAVHLTEEQVKAFADLCAAEKISRAAAVRRAITAYLENERAKNDVFGLWSHRAIDGLEYQEAIRSEWDR